MVAEPCFCRLVRGSIGGVVEFEYELGGCVCEFEYELGGCVCLRVLRN